MSTPEYQEAPGSPGSKSFESTALTMKQYFLVNLSRCLIEMGGTALLAIIIYAMQGHLSFVLLSLWILTLFFLDISGAHFNPCVTLAVMFKKNSTFGKRRLKGLLYILFQFFGAILGTFVAKDLLSGGNELVVKTPYGKEESPHTF